MSYGKTIKIFLPDGKPKGFQQVEIANWSGQALSFPRSRLLELQDWEDEAKRPGVYFLFEKGAFSNESSVYIGESENVMERLFQHNRRETGKDFWTEAVILTSKDQSLTKGHIQYLESRLIQMTKNAGMYSIKNSVSPIRENLPKSDVASMNEFIENIKTVMGCVGHGLLEDIINNKDEEKVEKKKDLDLFLVRETKSDAGQKVKIEGSARIVDGGYVLRKGSIGSNSFTKSAPDSIKALRARLLDKTKHEIHGDRFLILEDIAFNSLTQAAVFLAGATVNGQTQWKYSDGVSFKERENEELKRIERSM